MLKRYGPILIDVHVDIVPGYKLGQISNCWLIYVRKQTE